MRRLRYSGDRWRLFESEKTLCFVADMCSDLVSVVDSTTMTRTTQISLAHQPELSVEQSGEALCYDSRVSYDGWVSCHSCYSRGHTCGQLNDNLSDGRRGIPKRVLSLLGFQISVRGHGTVR